MRQAAKMVDVHAYVVNMDAAASAAATTAERVWRSVMMKAVAVAPGLRRAGQSEHAGQTGRPEQE